MKLIYELSSKGRGGVRIPEKKEIYSAGVECSGKHDDLTISLGFVD